MAVSVKDASGKVISDRDACVRDASVWVTNVRDASGVSVANSVKITGNLKIASSVRVVNGVRLVV